ncbi:M15 family metallopeptidase [Rheinheimera sp. WS51]|uniref:M15 family metallopeptidase n=1 Tax=Rheinheimera sp. WS51 TaxID=3425886 RepID=UPI003D8B36FE
MKPSTLKALPLLAGFFAAACCSLASLSATAESSAAIPADFVDVATIAPSIQVHMAYFTPNNFVGTVIDGYKANKCILHTDAAHALAKAQQIATEQGYSLWLFDCYRPQRAVDHFMRWAADLNNTKTKAEFYPNLAKDILVGDYIAQKSGHSRGSTVDLTLAKQDNNGQWQQLDTGSPFDLFDPISNVGASGISQQQQANRQQLLDIMTAAGFKVYNMEWWHFTHQPPAYTNTYFDFMIR